MLRRKEVNSTADYKKAPVCDGGFFVPVADPNHLFRDGSGLPVLIMNPGQSLTWVPISFASLSFSSGEDATLGLVKSISPSLIIGMRCICA